MLLLPPIISASGPSFLFFSFITNGYLIQFHPIRPRLPPSSLVPINKVNPITALPLSSPFWMCHFYFLQPEEKEEEKKRISPLNQTSFLLKFAVQVLSISAANNLVSFRLDYEHVNSILSPLGGRNALSGMGNPPSYIFCWCVMFPLLDTVRNPSYLLVC